MGELLALREVKSGYGRSEVVHGANLVIAEGEVTTILGSNGAGKTTLLRTIAGLVPLRSGQIHWQSRDMGKLDSVTAVKHGIVLVPEGRQIFQTMTVRENLLMGAYLRKGDPEITTDLERMIEHFPVLGNKLGGSGAAMSGGEQQMLAIARGLMARPKLLLLDEPSLGLAPIMVDSLRPIIGSLAGEFGTAVLLVEQSISLALGVAQRAALMQSGHLHPAITAAEMHEAAQRDNLYMDPGHHATAPAAVDGV